MKLIIQIPCYNEEETIAVTLSALPRKLAGIDEVQWLIVDDGSTDRTVEIARENGVDHIVRHSTNQGLARAFMSGLNASIKFGADIIVNTDADNQYNADDIPRLIEPILSGNAEIVVGSRPIEDIEHFSFIKKALQKIGSWVVRVISNTDIPDAPSGFRAISRDAAMKINVFSRYTYTLETIIQAGQKGFAISAVPIRTNKLMRPSRLVKSIPSYVTRSILTIIRIFITYRPFLFLMSLGVVMFGAGLLLGFRFIYFFLVGEGQGHIQSVILTSILIIMGFQIGLFGIIADLLSVNRRLLEEIRYQMRIQNLNGRSKEGDGP